MTPHHMRKGVVNYRDDQRRGLSLPGGNGAD